MNNSSSYIFSHDLTPSPSFRSCLAYLRNLSLNVVEQLERQVAQMLSKYVILPGYLDDASDRMHDIIIWAQKVTESRGS